MKKLFSLFSIVACSFLLTQCVCVPCEDQVADPFLSGWLGSNSGTDDGYGGLYASDNLPSCPEGYHLPTKADFEQLLTYSSVWTEAGPQGASGFWFCPTDEALASPSYENGCVFFGAAGMGEYVSGGSEVTGGRTNLGAYWSATMSDTEDGKVFYLSFTFESKNIESIYPIVTGTDGSSTVKFGLSVRCLKNAE